MSVDGCEVMMGAVGVAAMLTSSTAVLLVTDPALLVTTTEKLPALGSATAGKVSTALVAPVMFTPSRRHWNENGPVPSTPTASVAVLPTFAVTLAGCVTIDGATAAGALADTVKMAELLVDVAGAVAHRHAVSCRRSSGVTAGEAQHRAVRSRECNAIAIPLVAQRFGAARIDGEHGVAARGHAEARGLGGDAKARRRGR